MARRWWVLVALVPLLRGSLLFTGGATASAPRVPRAARQALDAEGLASFASFSVLAGSPIPLALGGLLRKAEIDQLDVPVPAPKSDPSPLESFLDSLGFKDSASVATATTDTPEPRDLMWAFPSFAIFLDKVDETAPSNFPLWARWLCLLTFWPGVIWYLYYKLLVEDDLREFRGLGIGGSLVIVPFALGLFAGVFGEFAYGALEGGFFDNGFAVAFYSAFAWIYLNQWFLYQKVNQLIEEAGRPAPLDPFGLFIPGWNFVTGIRQIHFLETLGPTCGPKNQDLCDQDKKKKLEEFMKMPIGDLKKLITEQEALSEKAETELSELLKKLQEQYETGQKEKERKQQEIKDAGLGLMKSVQAYRKTEKNEL